jgi:hypothetical protein
VAPLAGIRLTNTEPFKMQLRRSQRNQAATGERRPSLLSRLLHPTTGATTSSTLFGRKKKSHTPILGSSNNDGVIGSNSNSNPITGRRKHGPLFGRKKKTGIAAILDPNQSVRQESVGDKINRFITGRPKQSTADRILGRGGSEGTKRRQLF